LAVPVRVIRIGTVEVKTWDPSMVEQVIAVTVLAGTDVMDVAPVVMPLL
jgi:hypothetical protein